MFFAGTELTKHLKTENPNQCLGNHLCPLESLQGLEILLRNMTRRKLVARFNGTAVFNCIDYLFEFQRQGDVLHFDVGARDYACGMCLSKTSLYFFQILMARQGTAVLHFDVKSMNYAHGMVLLKKSITYLPTR